VWCHPFLCLQFIIRNGASALNLGYRQSAVGLLSITLDKSKQLNLVQEAGGTTWMHTMACYTLCSCLVARNLENLPLKAYPVTYKPLACALIDCALTQIF
jgi:hypothetical protein